MHSRQLQNRQNTSLMLAVLWYVSDCPDALAVMHKSVSASAAVLGNVPVHFGSPSGFHGRDCPRRPGNPQAQPAAKLGQSIALTAM